jgi:hypothetical protein
MIVLELKQPIVFEWDKGNQAKSFAKHNITNPEAEEVFLNFNIILEDFQHSSIEQRFIILGKCDNGKMVFSSFTVRVNKVRIISSRLANKKERNLYEEAFKKTSQI